MISECFIIRNHRYSFVSFYVSHSLCIIIYMLCSKYLLPMQLTAQKRLTFRTNCLYSTMCTMQSSRQVYIRVQQSESEVGMCLQAMAVRSRIQQQLCKHFESRRSNVEFHLEPVCGHYHLEVQANPKKLAQKNQCYFQYLWEKRDYPMTFFSNSLFVLSRLLRSNEKKG